MKYIRTKDGIIVFGKEYAYPTRIVKGNQHYIFTELTEVTFEKMKNFNRWDIINQANTIEELCDEFVLVDETLPPHIDRDFKEIKMYKVYIAGSRGNIYGAIWTDKGLIYVAKMNDKGELVLI